MESQIKKVEGQVVRETDQAGTDQWLFCPMKQQQVKENGQLSSIKTLNAWLLLPALTLMGARPR